MSDLIPITPANFDEHKKRIFKVIEDIQIDDLDQNLHGEIEKSAKENGRSESGEVRFQLRKVYKENEKWP